jgi:hypothetical protein
MVSTFIITVIGAHPIQLFRIISHSVNFFLFSSAKPRDFDGMLGTGLPVSIYTTKTPIDKCRF